ncbi:uncharacterized protein LOC133984407 [Scomber scombrus]|uniref:uncharacterized protein LOC133984407 n=1 Tax=Scomber scombrus TaxID=13677 RepID=UPI002DDB0FFA|nr:uncharacterized protein LOC133984407 [Scomber scombrus]
MKLILSLTVIWTLSSTAEALQCWHGTGDTKELRPCNSTDMCASVGIQVNVNGSVLLYHGRFCVPSSLFSEGNHIISLSTGVVTESVSVHVCNTDGCNDEAIIFPGIHDNNLQCFTCDDPSSDVCKMTLQCVGVQDRCLSGTVKGSGNTTVHTVGCISANLCEETSDLEYLLGVEFIRGPKCCGSSFCNSAWSVKLNVMTLLFGLITLIFY